MDLTKIELARKNAEKEVSQSLHRLAQIINHEIHKTPTDKVELRVGCTVANHHEALGVNKIDIFGVKLWLTI